MAHQPALNEEALVKLGSEKLASMVIGEAKRNAAFRKLVAAALAATKGPAAVAAIIDKRLAGLDRAKAFVVWEKAKAFTADIAATLATITGELASGRGPHAGDWCCPLVSRRSTGISRVGDWRSARCMRWPAAAMARSTAPPRRSLRRELRRARGERSDGASRARTCSPRPSRKLGSCPIA